MLKFTLINSTLEVHHTNNVVQCNTVPNKNTMANMYVYQDMIPFKNNKKLITCEATTVSCGFNWLYHADFSLK